MLGNFVRGFKKFFNCCYIAIIVVTVTMLFVILYFTYDSAAYASSGSYQKYFLYRAIIVISFSVFVVLGGIISTFMRIRRMRREERFKEEYFIEKILIEVASKEELKSKVNVALNGIVRSLKFNKAIMFIGKSRDSLEILYNYNLSQKETNLLRSMIMLETKNIKVLRERYTLAFHFQIYGILMYIFLERNTPLSKKELNFLKKYARAMRPIFTHSLLLNLMIDFMVELQKVGTVYSAYWKMLDMAVRVFNADSGAVLDVSKGKGNWTHIAVKNISGRDVEIIEQMMNQGDYNGPVIDIVKNKKVLYINDTAEYKTWVYTKNMPRSYIGIPFIVENKVVAVLSIHGDKPNKFGVYDVNLAKAIMDMGSAILERVLYLERLGIYSSIDEMTKLFNKREFMQRIKEEVDRAQRYGRKLSILIFDLDNFKEWNDTFGHLAGDRLLREIGEIVKGSIRSTDLAFRFGGDEFVVLFPETSLDGAFITARKILENISRRFNVGNVKLSASAGIAEYKPGETPEEFINRADRALYAAKNSGKNEIYIAS